MLLQTEKHAAKQTKKNYQSTNNPTIDPPAIQWSIHEKSHEKSTFIQSTNNETLPRFTSLSIVDAC